MSKWVDISGISIPSDENDYYELVAFADAIAELEPIYMESVQAEAYNRGIDSERKRIADAWCKAEYERGYKDGRESAERKGEWIIEKAYCDYYKYRCSNCDYYEIRPYSDCDTFNYCPNCGAKMKGADDE